MRRLVPSLLAVAALSTLTACGAEILYGAGAAVAGAAVGHTVIQERSTGQALDDVVIETSIATRFVKHSGELYRDVQVNVHEGRVLLAGSVPRREHKIFAIQQVWDVQGVVEVADEITVEEDSGTQAYLNDVLISNKVRFALLTAASVRLINFDVVTVDRIVHITGIARNHAERAQVLDIAASTSGVDKVVGHMTLIGERV